MSEFVPDMEGCELAAVTFIRDYIQLEFDGPQLTLISDPTVTTSSGIYKRSDPGFCNALTTLIGKVVKSVQAKKGDVFSVTFVSDEVIAVSLLDEDRFGPEAVIYRSGNGSWNIW